MELPQSLVTLGLRETCDLLNPSKDHGKTAGLQKAKEDKQFLSQQSPSFTY